MSDRDDQGLAPPLPDDDCPLPQNLQRRNILLYGVLWGLYYLAAPITYVGLTHANLLRELGEKDTTANLPSALYMWLTGLPVIFALLFPQPRLAKPILVGCLGGMALISGLVAATLWFETSKEFRVGMILLHGVVLGIGSGLSYPAQWEILRRGVSTSRRGAVMALAFGAGPVLACVGSLAQQFILSGTAHGLTVNHFDFPRNYALLFALGAPVMLVAAASASRFVVPPATEPEVHENRGRQMMQSIRDFFSYRPIYLGVICYVLVYAGGNAIMQTVSLLAPQKISGVPDTGAGSKAGEGKTAQAADARTDGSQADGLKTAETNTDKAKAAEARAKASQGTVGYQNELRFGFKAIAGLLLGWLLARTHPKAALLATTSTLVVAMFWALLVTGKPYLFAMGLLGAGELFGAYYPNYVVSASRKHRVRVNMAFLSLLSTLVGFASLMFGRISDNFGRLASIQVATGMLIVTMLVVILGLPKDPTPAEPAAAES